MGFSSLKMTSMSTPTCADHFCFRALPARSKQRWQSLDNKSEQSKPPRVGRARQPQFLSWERILENRKLLSLHQETQLRVNAQARAAAYFFNENHFGTFISPREGKHQCHFPLLRRRLQPGDRGLLLEPGGILGPTGLDPGGG